MHCAFVWCFIGSVLAQAARAGATCCQRSVLCSLLVIEYARHGKKLLCTGRMVIKIFPVGNAVLWMFSAGTSRKVGARGKWQSEWSVLWSGGRHNEKACKLIAQENRQRSRSWWMQMDCAVEQGGGTMKQLASCSREVGVQVSGSTAVRPLMVSTLVICWRE